MKPEAPVAERQHSTATSLTTYLGGFVVLVVLVVVLVWNIFGMLGVNAAEVLADLRTLQRNHQVEGELDRKLAFHRQRIAQKDAISVELLRGRCSLQEAVERFHELTAEDAMFRERVQAQFPDVSPEEALFRHVARYALLHGSRLPNIQTLRARLENELAQRFEPRMNPLSPVSTVEPTSIPPTW